MKDKSFLQVLSQGAVGIASVVWLLVGCGAPPVAPTPFPSTATPVPPVASTPTVAPPSGERPAGLSDEEFATLSSLEKVDDYPLYTMRYYGAYNGRASSAEGVVGLARTNLWSPHLAASSSAWACSLFAALGDADNVLYGRNFDWEYSPALLLFTDPPQGYASVSVVDIAYLGFTGSRAGTATDVPVGERRALLRAPFMPFDGMNEQGLAIGMAAVPPGEVRPDPDKETIGSLMVIREMLDHARNVDEAVAILQGYNISMEGGPPLHYLIADSSGRAVLVEFYRGETVIVPNETPWHQATNFLRATVGDAAGGKCWRYDEIHQRLAKAKGEMTQEGALELLENVSQEGTQWSVVYGMSTGHVRVVMGREYGNVHAFQLSSALPPTAN